MNVLVTGGKGFLGTHLVKRLEELGHKVWVADLPDWDIIKIRDVEIDMWKIDVVFHLAALKGIPACDADPQSAIYTNTYSTTRLLQECEKSKMKPRFVYASTWAVNSRNLKMYDVSKKAAEEVVKHFIHRKGYPGMILRMATFYGPGMARVGAINVFADCNKKGLPAPVLGDGREARQYTHVKDVVEALVTLAEHGIPRITPYVVTAKEVISTIDLAKKMCGEVEFKPMKDATELYTILEADDLETLGWEQQVSLEDGITEMINHE